MGTERDTKALPAVVSPVPGLGPVANLQRLLESTAFREAQAWFATGADDSLISLEARAFLYLAIRMLRPRNVLEVGTYKGGTAQLLAMALEANGSGHLVTLDPYGHQTAVQGMAAWPEALRRRTRLHLCSSMEYWRQAEEAPTALQDGFIPEFDFALVDGNHTYDFVTYDLGMLARHLSPGGIIVCDNFDQAGVFWAVKHFFDHRRGWTALGDPLRAHSASDPFRSMAPSFSQQIVLVAPGHIYVTDTPVTFGTRRFRQPGVRGLELELAPGHGAGTLHLQSFFRSFDQSPRRDVPEEIRWIGQVRVDPGQTHLKVAIPAWSTRMDPGVSIRMGELTLAWESDGQEGLPLAAKPEWIASDSSRIAFV